MGSMSNEEVWSQLEESELRAIIHQQFQEIRSAHTMDFPIQFIDDRLDIINTARLYLSRIDMYIPCTSCGVTLRRCDKIFACCRKCQHTIPEQGQAAA
jgi:hypothetical protein